jgi:thiol-disulfide isomerase/thioredoxin
MKPNIALMAVVGLLFAGAGAWIGTRALPGAATPPAVATSPAAAPPASPVASLLSQSLANADGTMQALAQWRGRPLVVNFWATWCTPCVEEMPALSALQTEIAARKVQIIGIGIDSPTNIRQFASTYKITYPLYVGGLGGTDLTRAFGNQGGSLPYTVLIGADGKVVKRYLGKLKMDELRSDIAALPTPA